MSAPAGGVVARVSGLTHRYGATRALDDLSWEIPSGAVVGIIGADGVGKSTLLGILAGAKKIQIGDVEVLGGNMRNTRHRVTICPRIAYLPQGLGGNLYADLTVFENTDFFGRLFGLRRSERLRRIGTLLANTGLAPFADRLAKKLSGGMRQKLGLCCALVHDPDLLILDEPTTGVDPLSRRQFWLLIAQMRARRPGMSVIVATAYMEEAERFDWLVAMHGGKFLATGHPAELLQRTATSTLEQAFIALLPPDARAGHKALQLAPRDGRFNGPAVAAHDLTRRFGTFTAVDRVNIAIARGEIFGFVGSNGCGKTTTMKMLTGLLPPSEGSAEIFGQQIRPRDMAARRRVGYMSQSFSLYGELTARQNLKLHARLFGLPSGKARQRIAVLADRFGLAPYLDIGAARLSLGIRQRLSLAVAVVHEPDILILDEPTSGVDPIARDAFWELLGDLSRNRGVTIFISTHFMNEAERCDRVALMHAGKILATDTPDALIAARRTATLEDAFIGYLSDADRATAEPPEIASSPPTVSQPRSARGNHEIFSVSRLLAYARCESLAIWRDPARLAVSLIGTLLLMLIFGFGVTLDVENLTYAALDRDQTPASRSYLDEFASSRYFRARPSLLSDAELDRELRAGRISFAIEIPPGFGRALTRGTPTEVSAWIDGAMPFRAETIEGYLRGVHRSFLDTLVFSNIGSIGSVEPARIEVRFRYNQEFKSVNAMVPSVIALLLMLIPAMLTALGVVREKELGSIVNLYVTPVSRIEFLLGKQLPYIGLAVANFLCLVAIAVWLFGVPLKGSFAGLALAGLLYAVATTSIGLVISAFTRTQIAAQFGTTIATILPAVQFSGLLVPVSSLTGMAAVIGNGFPTTYFLKASVGAFTKALSFNDLAHNIAILAVFVPALTLLAILFLAKQDR